jgi:hypothetical protein
MERSREALLVVSRLPVPFLSVGTCIEGALPRSIVADVWMIYLLYIESNARSHQNRKRAVKLYFMASPPRQLLILNYSERRHDQARSDRAPIGPNRQETSLQRGILT